MKRLIIALLVACTIIGFLLRLGSGGQVLRLSARELQQSGFNTGHSLTFNLQPSTLKSLLSLTFNLGPSALLNGQSSTGGTGGTSSGGIGTSTLSGQNVRTLVSIVVTPANATINAGSTQQYTATGNYSDGSQQNITASVSGYAANVGYEWKWSSGFGILLGGGVAVLGKATATDGVNTVSISGGVHPNLELGLRFLFI